MCMLMSKNSLVDKGRLVVVIPCMHSLAPCWIHDMDVQIVRGLERASLEMGIRREVYVPVSRLMARKVR